MSFSFELISHPHGGKNSGPKLLKDHLRNVGSIARETLNNIHIAPFHINNKLVSKDELSKLAYIIGISHDFGKSTTYFQRHIRNEEEQTRTELSFHSQISSLFGYYLAYDIMKDKELAYVAYLSIYYHHGDLRDPHRNIESLFEKETNIKKQVDDIARNSVAELEEIYAILLQNSPINISNFLTANKITSLMEEIKKIESEHLFLPQDSYDYYFLVLFLYSILLYSDKMDAASLEHDRIMKERDRWRDLPPAIIDKALDSLREKNKDQNDAQKKINALRDRAFQEAVYSLDQIDFKEHRILTIELPTGLGKTLISYAIALRIRETIRKDQGFIPRIIYSLPFLSIIDQNFLVIKDALSEFVGMQDVPTSLLLQHHHLSDIQFTFGKDRDSDVESYTVQDTRNRFLLMEGWNSELIVTSFVQLFHTIITNRNASVMKFHNIANSIIILDEVQSIPYEYLMLIGSVLKFLAYSLNCWVILMTATMPIMFSDSEITPVIRKSHEYFQLMSRTIYKRISEPIRLQDMVTLVLETENKDILVVMNTIGSSRELYTLLKERFAEEKGKCCTKNGYADFGDLCLVNLSTAIIPIQRKERIEKLKKKVKGERRIAITTQLIEAGVDIDFDIVFRDEAPLDSIIQAGGRANRNGEKDLGEVRLVTLLDEKGNSYASKIYDPTLLDASKEILDRAFKDKQVVYEKSMHDPVIDYYRKLNESKSRLESKKYKGSMKNIQFSEIGKFKLIDERFPKVDVFIPYDNPSKELWKEYLDIKNMRDPIGRWEKMLSIRNRFYEYVVSVSIKVTGNIDEPVINSEDISVKYDKEVGVIGIDSIW